MQGSGLPTVSSPAPVSHLSGAQPPAPKGWGGVATATFWAILIFVVINVVLWKAFPLDKVSGKDLWNGTGSIDLALQDLSALKERPNVVLLGSSLVMFPFWAMDKERNGNIGDIFHHHFSHTMEDQLVNNGSYLKPTVFSLAIFGQMASDAYIYVDQFLQGNKTPDVLVLGIAPRDFSDSELPAPMATLSFKRLIDWSNFARYMSLYLPSWNDKADFLSSRGCFFYGNRWHLQKEVNKAVAKVYAFFGVAGPAPAAKGQAGFMLSGSNEERWKNSLDEYRRRYRNIEARDLSIQMNFLDKLLDVCKERHIKAIIVNMPLTDVNRELFPSGWYSKFRRRVAAICDRPGVQLLDLGESTDFVHDDYWDTTHLSHYGGHKLLQHLVPLFKN